MRLILLLALVLASCSKKSESPAPTPTTAAPPATAPAPTMTAAPKKAPAGKDPDVAKQLIASGAPVVDVRTADEVKDGALPGAKHIPIDEFDARIAEVGADKSQPIVLYCASGNRAGKAKAKLEAAGYTYVVNGGGYDDLR
jgi:phage shock protein E